MGTTDSKISIGTKSTKTQNDTDENIDYKNEKNMRKAKNELYYLFLNDKLIHVEKIEEIQTEMDKLKKEFEIMKSENKELLGKLQAYDNLNKSNDEKSETRPSSANSKSNKSSYCKENVDYKLYDKPLKKSKTFDDNDKMYLRNDNKKYSRSEETNNNNSTKNNDLENKISRISEKIKEAQKNIKRSKNDNSRRNLSSLKNRYENENDENDQDYDD
jgi:hypothetical protein